MVYRVLTARATGEVVGGSRSTGNRAYQPNKEKAGVDQEIVSASI